MCCRIDYSRNDQFYDQFGNNTYLFDKGDGQDSVDFQSTNSTNSTIKISGVSTDDIMFFADENGNLAYIDYTDDGAGVDTISILNSTGSNFGCVQVGDMKLYVETINQYLSSDQGHQMAPDYVSEINTGYKAIQANDLQTYWSTGA